MIQDIRDRGGDEDTHLDEQIKFHLLKREKANAANIPREEWVECFGSLIINPTAQPVADVDEEEEADPPPAPYKKTTDSTDD